MNPPNTSNPIDKYVGARIKHFRNLRNMSQAKLAEQLNITFQQVQKYENAGNRVSASRLWEISKVLGVQVQDFYAGYVSDEDEGSSRSTSDITAGELKTIHAIRSIPEDGIRRGLTNIIFSMAEQQQSAQ